MAEEKGTRSVELTPAGAHASVRIRVIEGADAGAEARLSLTPLIAGTAEGCGLRLSDPSVSRQHAELSLAAGRVKVRDLGSKNGTRHLGAKVDSLSVPVGGVIELGATKLALLPAAPATDELSTREEVGALFSRSTPMRRLFRQLELVAPTEATVLLLGEAGAGKEEVARAIHALSGRSGPFLSVDCATFTPPLAATRLFGPASANTAPSQGKASDDGTLFLDQVGELPPKVQPMLLRAVDRQEALRPGEAAPRRWSPRVVASSRVPLEELLAKGQFRADLLHRLSTVTLQVPPLRERPDDIPLLAERFAKELGHDLQLSGASLACLTAYHWPGNVRELRNLVERTLAVGVTEALPTEAEAAASAEGFSQARLLAVKAFERSYLEALLRKHQGSATRAAREAKMSRSYLYELLAEHGLRAKD
ncbi:MAG: sigma 54-dependent Fis family transcriptional regulator [Myxococcales bacterium]|nr:sigma 54-dependent Fis family transcriptional regulator [Myxococcales bacterium]